MCAPHTACPGLRTCLKSEMLLGAEVMGSPPRSAWVRGEAVAQAEGEGRAGAGAKGNRVGFFSPGSTRAILEFLARRSLLVEESKMKGSLVNSDQPCSQMAG